MALTKIETDGIKDDAVTSGKIPANAVGNSEIADDAVTSGKIADGAVSNSRLAANAVTAAKILDGEVTLAKLEHGTSSNDGKFLRANNGADPTFETVNTTPAAGSITTAMLANDAVDSTKIADDAITSAQMAANSVNTSELINDAVNSDKIADAAISNNHVNSSAAIAGTKISPNFGSQNVFTSGTLECNGEFKPRWFGRQSQTAQNTYNTTVYWKVAEITGGGSQGGQIVFFGTNSYSANSGQYTSARTTLIVRHTTGNSLDGFYWSESGGNAAVEDIRWKYNGANNVYTIWIKKGAYNNVVPHVTGSFENVTTYGSSTGSGGVPSGSTAFDNRWSVKMKDNSSDAISIDNEGLVTYPARPCFHGGSSGNTASSNYVEYDVVFLNRGSHYATNNDRFVCPCDGIYYVSLFGMSYNSQGTMDIALRKNGSDYHGLVPYSASGGGTYHHCAGSALVSCSENDYLQVHVNAGSMYGASNGRHTGFTVFLVA